MMHVGKFQFHEMTKLPATGSHRKSGARFLYADQPSMVWPVLKVKVIRPLA